MLLEQVHVVEWLSVGLQFRIFVDVLVHCFLRDQEQFRLYPSELLTILRMEELELLHFPAPFRVPHVHMEIEHDVGPGLLKLLVDLFTHFRERNQTCRRIRRILSCNSALERRQLVYAGSDGIKIRLPFFDRRIDVLRLPLVAVVDLRALNSEDRHAAHCEKQQCRHNDAIVAIVHDVSLCVSTG